MRTVAVTGASGFIGRRLVEGLRQAGYRVIALSRRPGALTTAPGVEARRFDPNDSVPNPGAFEGAGCVVHLAGESVAGRWTDDKKRKIAESRVQGTRNVVDSLAACASRPTVLITPSGSGYYGARGDEPLFETSLPGVDFLSGVCRDWERESRAAAVLQMRTVQLRTGIVLGEGGALEKMLPIFERGFGGSFGSGSQFVPWIHIDDLVALYIYAIEHPEISGAINAVAPDYATSARFAQALGNAVGKPALVPAPAFALRAVLGEFADTLTTGQLMLPAVAEDSGFTWAYANLEAALIDVVSKTSRTPALREFTAEQLVEAPLEQVFKFFSDAQNLQRITPANLSFAIRSSPAELQRGSIITYRLRLRGLPIGWKTMIARWRPPHVFVDVQLRGPYALWRHTHEFEETESGVLIRDKVLYAVPFPPLGQLVSALVDSDVRSIFAHRRNVIESIFSERRSTNLA